MSSIMLERTVCDAHESCSMREARPSVFESAVDSGRDEDGATAMAGPGNGIMIAVEQDGVDIPDANLFRTRSRSSGAHSEKQSLPWTYVPRPSASSNSRMTDAIAQQFSCRMCWCE